MAKRDLLQATDFNPEELQNLLDLAVRIKRRRGDQPLAGKALGLLFFDRSLRTRVSFEIAMTQLGGHCIPIHAANEIYDLEPEEQAVMDGPAEEHVKDAARTLSRYVDVLGVRKVRREGDWDRDRQELLLHSYARHATVPVINLESVNHHPCQAFADLLTMKEQLDRLEGRKFVLAWSNHPEQKPLGPAHSVAAVAASVGMEVRIAHPLGFELDNEVMQTVRDRATAAGGSVQVFNDLNEATDGAEVVYARSWAATKHWDDAEREAMVKRSLEHWRVDSEVMARTNNACFMHPLPVRRNVVATDDVLDGPKSVIYDQAENRVHVQKALLMTLL